MTKVKIIAITGATDTISESFRKYLSNIMERMKSRKYRKQPFWTLHTYTSESGNANVHKV